MLGRAHRMKILAFFLAAALVWPIAARAADPHDCGTVIVPANADITSFSPLFANALANGQAAEVMYENLIWIDRHAQIDWSRSLVTAITASDDGTTYDVTLRPWHWSDGTLVTSADVLYGFKLIKELGTTFPGYGQGGMPDIIKSLTATDATHFRVVLTHPANPTWFIYEGLSQLTPLPSHDWSRYNIDQLWQLQTTPSFYKTIDGPLRLERFDIGRDAVYVPNPAFDGPKVKFSRFIFTFIEGDGVAVQQIEAGNIDVSGLPTEFYSGVQHIPGVRIEQIAPQASYDYLGLNLKNSKVAFFRDVRVRDAMADSQDQKKFIQVVLHGLGYEVHGPVTPANLAFEAPQLQRGDYPTGYDPAKARALLKAAGFTPGPDGIMQKDGQRLSFVVLTATGSTEGDEMIEFIQADLRAVGIEMKVHEVEFNQMLAIMNGPADGWEAADSGMYSNGYPSGEGLFATGAYLNNGGYSDKTMDQLINDSVNKPGLSALYAYEIYASAQQPVIFGASPAPVLLVSDRLHGVYGFYDPGGLDPTKLYCTSDGGTES